jgi:hypothetical protein
MNRKKSSDSSLSIVTRCSLPAMPEGGYQKPSMQLALSCRSLRRAAAVRHVRGHRLCGQKAFVDRLHTPLALGAQTPTAPSN